VAENLNLKPEGQLERACEFLRLALMATVLSRRQKRVGVRLPGRQTRMLRQMPLNQYRPGHGPYGL
jgi:hypothetical protein